MAHETRPLRSVLYIPASNVRALEKARGLAADAIIFDLEDAVSPDAKKEARDTLVAALEEGGYEPRVLLVRINALDTEWGKTDAAAFAKAKIDGLLLPKAASPDDIGVVAQLAPELPIWAMMECPAGILHAQSIAAHPRMGGFVMGTNDLAKDLGSRGRKAMLTSLQLCLLAARAAGIPCIDGVYNAFRDEEGLREECEEARDMGFDGKTLIHPAQVAIANAVFAPSEDEIELARKQIEAFEAAQAEGKGVAVVGGRIVENLHIVTAKALLDKAAAIAELEK